MHMPSLTSWLSILADTASVCHVTLQTVFVQGYTHFDTLFPFVAKHLSVRQLILHQIFNAQCCMFVCVCVCVCVCV